MIDAGGSWTFNGATGAASTTWRINGETVSTNPSFVDSPDINAVGTHWLQCEQTFADGTKSAKEWGLRVRIPVPASDLRLFVAPNGSDTNTGSIGSPFLTLEKARDTIRALPRPLPAGGVTVYLRGGIHRRSSSFSLTTSDSGDSASAPIIYAGYPGETAIVSNGKALNSARFRAAGRQRDVACGTGRGPGADLGSRPHRARGREQKSFPADFDHWPTYNIYASSYDGGIFDVYYNNTRAWISRYPNQVPDEMVAKNPTLKMNGVALVCRRGESPENRWHL